MKNTPKFPLEIYNASLKEIHGIAFSSREIEVIAAILLEKPNPQIPDILSIIDETQQNSILFTYKISEKTVASHIEKIYEKLSPLLEEHINDLKNKTTKRDKIKYVIEKSKVRGTFNEYCVALQLENVFLSQLEKIFQKRSHYNQKQNSKNQLIIENYLVNYCGKNIAANLLPTYFAKHLNSRRNKNESKIITTTLKEENLEKENKAHADYVFYIIPDDFRIHLSLEGSKVHNIFKILVDKASENSCRIFFLLDNWKNKKHIVKDMERVRYIHLDRQKNYYESFFEILKRIFPEIHFDEEIKAFKKDFEDLNSRRTSNLKKKILVGVSALCLTIFSTGLLLYNFGVHNPPPIRSDLPIPIDSVLLQRPNLITEIEKKLKGQQNINTVALIGIGGAGKTILARQYAHQHKVNVIWEINAETKGSLIESFENLAYALSQSEEEKRILRGLQDIKDSKEREGKLIQFIKGRLRLQTNWLLIFDNVEKFEDIQNYFPNDPHVWGKGKVIVTTRDSTIQNHIHVTNTIHVSELDPKEKLDFFMKIMCHGVAPPSISTQRETQNFLQEIPPFPLDITIAANYLKLTGISYEKYLDYLRQSNKDFEEVQEKMLKESGNYTKTRYNIITLSLKQLIDMHKDFKDLLLLISMLDSQDIPRDLLDSYKANAIVDSFIYTLTKYSLITINSPSSYSGSLQTISLHRSTQRISRDYLVKEINLEKNPQFFQSITCVVEKFVADAIEKQKITYMKNLMNHTNTILKHEIIPIASKKNLYFELGRIYIFLIRNKEAMEMFELIIKHIDTLNSMEEKTLYFKSLAYLGIVNREMGNYHKAKTLLENAVTFYRKYTLNDLNKFSLTLLCLGIVNRDCGNFAKAKDLMIESLTIYRNNFSEDWVNIAQVLTYLGSVENELGNYESAKASLEESLNIYKNFLPENYFGIDKVLSHLADSYINLKDFSKARKLLERSYSIDKSLYDDNKAGKSWMLLRMARINAEEANYEKAKTLLEESYTCCKEFYGAEHIQVGHVLIELGRLYLQMNNIKEAENYISQALKIFQQKEHPNYIALEALADLHLKKHVLLSNNGDMHKIQAISCLKQALQVVMENFSKDSPHIARLQLKLNHIELLSNN